MRAQDLFSAVPELPEDPMFGLSAAYRADQYSQKVDLGIGAYRDENAKRWILPSVRQAEARIPKEEGYDHEYLPIAGLSDFLTASAKLVFGDQSVVLARRQVATVQTLSGTGALHLGAALLAEFVPANRKTVYLSSPPYVNHKPIFNHVGFGSESYPYYSRSLKALDITGMLAALESIPEGSLILLHACAHNPTGADPTEADWRRISNTMHRKHHTPFFDLAYQGFATGDADADAWVIRHFVSEGFNTMLVAQSYAKNFGLYGERVGCLHVVTESPRTAELVLGQLKKSQRREVSTPPVYGARIVSTILNDTPLKKQWEADLKTMSARLQKMRHQLRLLLEGHDGRPGRWKHLTDQRGMFCYTGLSEAQVGRLRDKHHVYLTRDGRISVSGLNEANVKRTAKAIHSVSSAPRPML